MAGKTTKQDERHRRTIMTFLYIYIILILTVVVIRYVAQRSVVHGASMETTLSNGDQLIVEKLSYRLGDPKRYDIIVFPDQTDPEKYYIKRVIGMPNETIYIDTDGVIYIDGEPLEEDYGYQPILNPGNACTEILIPEGEYFVLGDNRNNSVDSRDSEIGFVDRTSIIGKAWLRIYPFSDIKLIEHGGEE